MRSRLSDVLASGGAIALTCGALACSSSSSGSGSGDGVPSGSCPALPTTCSSPPPSYKTDVQPLIVTYCYQCHSDGGPGFNQGTYDWTQLSVLQKNGSLISEEITDSDNCNMPYVPDHPKVLPSADDRTTIATWAGPCMAPNN